MNFAQFQKQIHISNEDICRETYDHNKATIRVKKQQKVIKNLERIFDATLKISNSRGFQAMSMRDLSRETGLSMGALYSYFASKEELLTMLQQQRRAMTRRILEECIQMESDAAAMLKTAIRTHLYLSEVMQPWFYFSFMETKNLPADEQDKAIASELLTEKMIADILKKGIQEGLFSVSDPLLTASVIKSMLQDWYLKRWKYAKRNITVDRYAGFVIEFVEAFTTTA
jgi:AcrR family transcriptional regulator